VIAVTVVALTLRHAAKIIATVAEIRRFIDFLNGNLCGVTWSSVSEAERPLQGTIAAKQLN